jgi:uncharacterized membrane protein (DUF4010 family)
MDALLAEGSPFAQLFPFLISLAIGLLIGLERERNPRAKAGLRTFALTSLLGTLCAMLSQQTGSPWILVVGLGAVGAYIVGAYLGEHAPDAEPGTTTEAALLVCYALGAMVWHGERELAIMLAIVTTVLLYFKPEMQGVARQLTRRDLVSMLQFAVLTFIVLPILPNQNFGPFQSFNPHQTWLMVVLISGISLAGYVALRLFGQRYGTLVLGFLGGLVSSTATTLVYARHGKAQPELMRLAVSVILLANLVVMVRLMVLSAVIAPHTLSLLAPALGTGLVLGLAVTFLQWRQQHDASELPLPDMANPAELRTAIGFGVMYAVVLFLASWVSASLGEKGLYGVAVVAGLTDVDAITLSALRLFTLEKITESQLATTVVIGLLANLGFKSALIFAIGGRKLGLRCVSGLLATGVGAAAALALI